MTNSYIQFLRVSRKTVQRDKCKFNQTAVDYLGHTVTPDGIKPKESLVTAVVDTPAPQNKEQLRSFLGLCEYMAKFVKNFASKAACDDERQSEFCLGRDTPEGV